MDPNANLKEMVNLAESILLEDDAYDGCTVPVMEPEMWDKAVRLAELVSALNKWIVKGGFLPDAWRKEN